LIQIFYFLLFFVLDVCLRLHILALHFKLFFNIRKVIKKSQIIFNIKISFLICRKNISYKIDIDFDLTRWIRWLASILIHWLLSWTWNYTIYFCFISTFIIQLSSIWLACLYFKFIRWSLIAQVSTCFCEFKCSKIIYCHYFY
jgi:hypothetical protein